MTATVDGDHVRAGSILRRLGLHANSAATGWVAEVIAGAREEGARSVARRPLPSTAPPALRQAIEDALPGLDAASKDYAARTLETWVRDLFHDSAAEGYDEGWTKGRESLAGALRRVLDGEVDS